MHKVLKKPYAGQNEDGVSMYRVTIQCDTAADMPEPEKHWAAGSTCEVLEGGGKTYTLSNAGAWVETPNFSGGGKGGDISLGLHSDGLIYVFVDGEPTGNGIALPSGGGDIVGNVDSDNNIILSGNLPDGIYTLKYEMDGSTVEIGELEVDTSVYYSVTSNLIHCTTNNNAVQVASGGSYSAKISAGVGYKLSSVVVTMGGSDISPSAVNGDEIYIANVTGDVIITATAKMVAVLDPVTVDIELTNGIRIGSDGTDRTQAGYCATPHIDLTNIPKPCTINLTKALWCHAGSNNSSLVRVYAKKADGTQLVSDTTRVDVGGSHFVVTDNSGIGNDVTVTVTSDDVGYIRFSGGWTIGGVSDSNIDFESANTKATLTYTPVA